MTYTLRCPACDHVWEVQMPMSMVDKGETPTCPRCDTEGEVQITGGVGVVLKGGGWYRDGYSHGGKK